MSSQPPPDMGINSPPSGPVTIRYQYRVRRYQDDGTPGGFGVWNNRDVTNGKETMDMWRDLAQAIDNVNIYSIDIHYVGQV
jgi:hypothetical protein